MKLDFSISLSVKVGHKHAVLYFCFFELGIRPSVFTEFKLYQVKGLQGWPTARVSG